MMQLKRPLSPHLQIYKPQLTSLLSITHRLTGIGLAIGSLIFVYFLVSLVLGSEAYELAKGFMRSWLGLIIIFLAVLGLSYHFLNGIRHLYWDLGRGLNLKSVYFSGWMVLFGTVGISFLVIGIILCRL